MFEISRYATNSVVEVVQIVVIAIVVVAIVVAIVIIAIVIVAILVVAIVVIAIVVVVDKERDYKYFNQNMIIISDDVAIL